MKTWEYKIVQLRSAGPGISEALAHWGSMGWELASVVLSGDGRFASLFVKRPAERPPHVVWTPDLEAARIGLCHRLLKEAGALGEEAEQALTLLGAIARPTMRHPNGAPMFSPDGETLLDDNGNRSIFDDIDT